MVKVNNKDDIVNNRKKFYPDGKYVPRILFYAPDGILIKEAYNKSLDTDSNNRYYYNTAAQIIDTMNFVLKLISDEEESLEEYREKNNDQNFPEPIVA